MKVKKVVRKSQAQTQEKVRKLRPTQNGIYYILLLKNIISYKIHMLLKNVYLEGIIATSSSVALFTI